MEQGYVTFQKTDLQIGKRQCLCFHTTEVVDENLEEHLRLAICLLIFACCRTVLLLQDQLLDEKNQMMKGEMKCRIESPKQG